MSCTVCESFETICHGLMRKARCLVSFSPSTLCLRNQRSRLKQRLSIELECDIESGSDLLVHTASLTR
jgi:hypothetical protein